MKMTDTKGMFHAKMSFLKDRNRVNLPEACHFSFLSYFLHSNNRIEKTRDLFKKIRDTKGTFHAKMGSRKDRNGLDLSSRY